MAAMTERFREHLRASGLIPEGSSVLLGYSGGADSTCLLHLLHGSGIDVIAAHLHHGQRPEADEELARCESLCKGIKIPFVSGRSDVPRIAREMNIGLEEAGRHARYEFFEQCRFRTDADLVATAHTLDDHVETVLLNLARGTGLHGLAGIAESRGHVVRPLLPFSRAETRRFCHERALWFHDDPANEDVGFSRVRMRKNVVTQLEKIHPAAKEAIARLARTVAEEDRFLDGMAAAALEQCETPLNGKLHFLSKDCEAAFDSTALLSLPRVLLARAVRLATGAVGASFDHHQTASAIDGIAGQDKGAVTADGGHVVLEWDRRTVLVRNLAVDAPYRFPLTCPGETASDVFGWKLTAQTTGPGEFLREPGSLDVVIDAGAVKGPLYFRSYQHGDSLRPLGLDGTKTVGEVMSGMGLTEAARRRLPILCDLVGPVWVPGGCIEDRVKVTPQTQGCIRLSFGPI
jgi:tRNA(Ile)-lysidine synthase